MSFSIFTSSLSEINIDFIRRFNDQEIPEGLRLDYKKEFIDGKKLAKIICSFANTNGGIILIGVLADKISNKPVAIPGIELRDGLE